MGSPDTSPSKHGLTSVLDLSFLQELLIWEHVWEGVEALAGAQLGQAKRVESNSANFLESGGIKGSRGNCSLLRGKGSGRNSKGCKNSGGQLGHGEGIWVDLRLDVALLGGCLSSHG